MKTFTKTLLSIAALTLSAGAFAHYSENSKHPMMDSDSAQYQAMQKQMQSPAAMHNWMHNMHKDPQAMQQWMEKMHANVEGDKEFSRFGCHGYWHGSENSEKQQ